MHGAAKFLEAITVVLCVAATTTVVFQRLRQPVVLGYLLSGLIVGPHVPLPLVADREIIHTLSELGVILLMFSLGLEFSLQKLLRVGFTAGLTAIFQSSIMVWLGFVVGRAFGWTPLESVFAGAIIAISSTTIIAKAFEERCIKGKLRELVVAILIVEDLIAIVLMAILTAISTEPGVPLAAVARSGARLLAFLVGLIVVGLLVVPRLVRFVQRLERPETTLVTIVALCFAVALLAHALGYSVALGAFIAGSLVAESGEEKRIGELVMPLRDVFAAIFFVSVGMTIDPVVIVRYWPAVAVLTGVVIVGKVVGVSLGAFLTGSGTRTSVQAGMSLAQIGEFSFIIAALGLSLGATREFLYPVAVGVSALTTLATPWLIRAAGPTASFVDRKLPRPLQTFAALYGAWIEQLRSRPPLRTAAARRKRLLRLLLLDAAILMAIVISVGLLTERVAQVAERRLGVSAELARVLVNTMAGLFAAPFAFGVFRVTRSLGRALARAAVPHAHYEGAEFGAAPRRAIVVTIQLAVALLVGLPLLAVMQPFLRGWSAAIGLFALVVVFGFSLWRSARGLEGHVKAGAQQLGEALLAQARKGSASSEQQAFAQLRHVMPGLGEPVPLRLSPGSPAVGRTLAQLDLRGLTGASVLAIARDEEGVIVPTASEPLCEGDVLALAGTHDAVAAAEALLGGESPAQRPA